MMRRRRGALGLCSLLYSVVVVVVVVVLYLLFPF